MPRTIALKESYDMQSHVILKWLCCSRDRINHSSHLLSTRSHLKSGAQLALLC